jgi:hypothetical protein
MAAELMPDWLRILVQGNPVNWAVNAGREAMVGEAWTAVWQYSIELAITRINITICYLQHCYLQLTT